MYEAKKLKSTLHGKPRISKFQMLVSKDIGTKWSQPKERLCAVYLPHTCRYPCRPEEGTGFLGTGVNSSEPSRGSINLSYL